MSEKIPFYNFQVPYDALVHPDMLYLSEANVKMFLESAMKQRQWHRENNHPKAEVNLNFGPIAFTTQECETSQNLMDKYQAIRTEQEREKRKLRENFLKSNNNPQLKETAEAFEKLNGAEMDEAIQKTSFDNILPLIEWFEKAASMYDNAHEKFSAACKVLDLDINAGKLERKLTQKGFPTYEQWETQTCYLVGDKEPELEEKYAKLNASELYGVQIASFIQYLSRPGTYMSHFWDFVESYKEQNAQKNTSHVVQKGHAKTPRIKPDSSRGDRTASF